MSAPTSNSDASEDAAVHWFPASDTATRVDREWLVTNGLGGYASGSVSGVLTRRYHGYLIAALPAPLGRVVMFDHLTERAVLPDGSAAALSLDAFGLDAGLPIWRYRVGAAVIEKRVVLLHRQNTVHVQYRRLNGDGPVRLELRPTMSCRPHEAPVSEETGGPFALTIHGDRYEVSPGGILPSVRLRIVGEGAALIVEAEIHREIEYPTEASRGYSSRGALWSPGRFRADLAPGHAVTLVASTESWETLSALAPDAALVAERERRRRLVAAAPPAARDGFGADLVRAADQFVISPAGRIADVARAQAGGDEVRTAIAGYHWFTDWGRDTMISLEGLTLATGRTVEAGYILRTFAHYVRDGLIPNLFPEGNTEGLYHTADATLWFFHALDRYVRATDDRATLRAILPTLVDIVEHHLRGTRFGIGVDPEDGLLRQGAEGYALTWMDAKMGDWVVTPRRGKAVEINALWYNALCLLEGWLRSEGEDAVRTDARALANAGIVDGARSATENSGHADAIAARARHARESFNRRFWYEPGGHLYDVVDGERGDDPDCRPNQLFAISLSHPILDRERWAAVVDACEARLLTPVGLRSLSPDHPDYQPRYDGDLRARDAAYHQGTVWGWLIGPYVDAYLKLHPDDATSARHLLDGFRAHLADAGVGQLSEIFDAEPPYTPRGCIAQAWSVAEVLRCWQNTAR